MLTLLIKPAKMVMFLNEIGLNLDPIMVSWRLG